MIFRLVIIALSISLFSACAESEVNLTGKYVEGDASCSILPAQDFTVVELIKSDKEGNYTANSPFLARLGLPSESQSSLLNGDKLELRFYKQRKQFFVEQTIDIRRKRLAKHT